MLRRSSQMYISIWSFIYVFIKCLYVYVTLINNVRKYERHKVILKPWKYDTTMTNEARIL